MKRTFQYLSSLFLITTLAAGCGGGGSGGSSGGGDGGGTNPSPLAPGGTGVTFDQVETASGGSTVTANFLSALAINDGNQVIGFAETTPGSSFTAVLWGVDAAGAATVTPATLSPLAGNGFNAAFALDEDGNAVGQSAKGAQLVAVLWPSGSDVPTELPALAANGNSAAYGISPDGSFIVGEAADASGRVRAVLWRVEASGASSPQVLPVNIFAVGTSLSPFSSAISVNDNGWIAGEVEDGEGGLHAVLWRPDSATGAYQATDLRRNGEESSIAFAINASGQIAGESESAPGVFVPAFWEQDAEGQYKRTDLAAEGSASDINDAGRIAGWETGGIDVATAWSAANPTVGTPLFANQSQAYGLNNFGLVVGREGGKGFVKRLP